MVKADIMPVVHGLLRRYHYIGNGVWDGKTFHLEDMNTICATFPQILLVVHISWGLLPDSKFHGANMGSTWALSAPDGPHVCPMNLAIRAVLRTRPRHLSLVYLRFSGSRQSSQMPLSTIMLYVTGIQLASCQWKGLRGWFQYKVLSY